MNPYLIFNWQCKNRVHEMARHAMSRVVRKPDFCICENKDADQLRGNREADQRLCFRYTDSTIPLLPKSEISSLQPSSVAVQPGLCRTWSETPKTGFLRTRLISKTMCVFRQNSQSNQCRLRSSLIMSCSFEDISRLFGHFT